MINALSVFRIQLLFLGLFSLFSIAALRLFFLQVFFHDFYQQKAEQQYLVELTIAPPRAHIYDQYGKALTVNKHAISAFITPKNFQDAKQVRNFLKRHFSSAYERLTLMSDKTFLFVKRRLLPTEIALIKKENIVDIHLIEEPCRWYPAKSCMQLVGLCDIDNRGIAGLEYIYEKILAGQSSSYTLEKDARSGHYFFSSREIQKGMQGNDLYLTIDSQLQELVMHILKEYVKELKAKEASALILDAVTGDILVMATYPCPDPENLSQEEIGTLKPSCATDAYELGSVMKIFPALAALEEKVVTADEQIDCENKKVIVLNGVKFSTWKAHGILPYEDVIALSNNVGTAKVTERLGPCLYDYLENLGFGRKTNIGLMGENPGFINPPSKWTRHSLYSLSFGYEMNATLVQLARAFTLFANDGHIVEPRIILDNKNPKISERPICRKETLDVLRTMLQKTITDGTAHRAKSLMPYGYTVLGKTGTANLLDENGKYDNDRNIFTFASVIERNQEIHHEKQIPYKRIITVFVREPEIKGVYASRIAVPLYVKVAEQMILREQALR